MFGVLKIGKLGASMKRAGFNPRTLFSASEPGAWYDTSDMSTLFQDAAGTVPVTAVEQPVGKMLDKSGRGNHATQATTTKRPTLKQDANGCYYLSFDGVDDAMQTGNIDFTSTDKMTVWAGVTKLSDEGMGIITELGATFGDVGAFALRGPTSAGASNFGAPINTGAIKEAFSGALSTPVNAVLAGLFDGAGDPSSKLRANGAQTSSAAGASGTAKFINRPIYIGARAGTSYYFNGRLYSLIVRGAQSSLSQIEAGEAYIKQKMRLP